MFQLHLDQFKLEAQTSGKSIDIHKLLLSVLVDEIMVQTVLI